MAICLPVVLGISIAFLTTSIDPAYKRLVGNAADLISLEWLHKVAKRVIALLRRILAIVDDVLAGEGALLWLLAIAIVGWLLVRR